MPGHDPVARLQWLAPGDFGAVEHCSVLAAEVAQGPAVALALERQMLARESTIIREREFRGAGAAERNSLRSQGYVPVLAVG